ncbi:peptide chain release factor 2 [Candidatus Uhrbacteria bacterium RIFOXYC2_FULL_47_19]|uniref:Peptide chain release factor 2 n=1 Tax=Candidatus Uhrbacteria bacterium RIFOXYC2_FULL_47_19 TaxID=1802424 RepID=A0A1F7WBE3_9BACT|nr:MAG: peptide chain release factor 2 [Candidatus Uhrbacteria bacterium RIFOXYC2_FULL_47_19]
MRRGGYFDLDRVATEIKSLEWETQQPEFWSDNSRAQDISRRLAELQEFYSHWFNLRRDVSELDEFARLASEEDDSEAEQEIGQSLLDLQTKFDRLEFSTLMDGEFDLRDAIVAIHAGAGGTDAQDWAEMLLRMMMRYGERHSWEVKTLDLHRGGEAGIKSATISVSGRYAYGHLKAEAGVHRLVRLSPFNSDQLRQTSFALIEVLPDLGEAQEVEIGPKDLRIDTFLAGGHGGQGVQTTYSAVRITHLPTGLVVSCQNERSQVQNKETAMRILKARLHARMLAERDDEKKKLRGEFTSAEWGNQIRSYVLHPYQLVKDHRTKHETVDTAAVLDGDLDPFIEAYLRCSKGKSAAFDDASED